MLWSRNHPVGGDALGAPFSTAFGAPCVLTLHRYTIVICKSHITTKTG